MNLRGTVLAGVALVALAAAPQPGDAGERHVTGAAIGAGIGAIIAGPPGAILGGAVGAVVKGPRVTKRRHCWTGKSGREYCEWR
jgi:osmotically inducible lipoprotein OsmB